MSTTESNGTACQCGPGCSRAPEQCHTCRRHLAHDFVHWNGDHYECESCAA